MSKEQLGYYYSESLKTVIIGYLEPRKYGHNLVGKVIGHTIPTPHWGHTYSCGYTYKQWSEGFVYVGRLTTFTTLKGYLELLKLEAPNEQIEAYLKIKKVVLERHGSHLIRHSNGYRYRMTYKHDALKRLGLV